MHDMGLRSEQRQTSDAELVRAAQGGDVASLGLLLERHRPALHSTALRILHDPARAHDAVQEAFVVALRRVGGVREAEAVGGWLHAVVRNQCLCELRRAVWELPQETAVDVADGRASGVVDEEIDRLALREWVWTALGRLSEPLRLTAMLRYFGSYASYGEIAAICAVPVGTVRSRLSQVKAKLADALLEAADMAHDDARDAARAEEARFAAAVAEINGGTGYDVFVEDCSRDVVISFVDGGELRGREAMVRSLDGDLLAGTKLRLTSVFAGVDLTVIEGRFENPPDDPIRCPPAMSQVRFHRAGVTERIRLYYAPRPGALRQPHQPQ
jgi:RNA polymerase sigma factor (sigma-70 family)